MSIAYYERSEGVLDLNAKTHGEEKALRWHLCTAYREEPSH